MSLLGGNPGHGGTSLSQTGHINANRSTPKIATGFRKLGMPGEKAKSCPCSRCRNRPIATNSLNADLLKLFNIFDMPCINESAYGSAINAVDKNLFFILFLFASGNNRIIIADVLWIDGVYRKGGGSDKNKIETVYRVNDEKLSPCLPFSQRVNLALKKEWESNDALPLFRWLLPFLHLAVAC